MAVAGEHIDGKSELFASNTLTIAVPAGNPGGVTDFASLAKPGLKVVVCAPEVPCGAAAVTVEKALGVTLTPVSELTNVTDVLGSVASGEADAGLVYVTDLARTKGVEGIAFAGSDNAITSYPIAVMTTGDAAEASRGFVNYVLGAHGQATLAAAGFARPGSPATKPSAGK
jgi:molybdate transport system substrate-binding protein